MPPSGLQDQPGPIHWDELEPEQEQRLLRQDNERLQREVQSTKADLAHSREKVKLAHHRRAGLGSSGGVTQFAQITIQVLNSFGE